MDRSNLSAYLCSLLQSGAVAVSDRVLNVLRSARIARYCTISVNKAVWETAPALAVTMIV
jgi:hypothetical protein